MTDCLAVTNCSGTQFYKTPMLAVGESVNIPNTQYSIKIVSIYCYASDISDNYTDVEIYRSNTLIATCRYYIDTIRNKSSSDLGYICLEFNSMACDTTPTRVGFDVYSTPLLGDYELRIKFLKMPGASESGLQTVLNEVIARVNSQVTILGYTYTGYSIDWNNSTFSLWYNGQSPQLALPAIITSIGILLLGIGVCIVAVYFLYDKILTQQTLVTKDKAKTDLDEWYAAELARLKNLFDTGQITPEQYQTQIAELEQRYKERLKALDDYYASGTDWASIAMWGAIAIIGYGILTSGILTQRTTTTTRRRR